MTTLDDALGEMARRLECWISRALNAEAENAPLRERAEAAEADVTRQMAIANEAVNARIAAEAALEAMRREPNADDIDDLAQAIFEDYHKGVLNVCPWEELEDHHPHTREIWYRHAKAAFAFLASRGK